MKRTKQEIREEQKKVADEFVRYCTDVLVKRLEQENEEHYKRFGEKDYFYKAETELEYPAEFDPSEFWAYIEDRLDKVGVWCGVRNMQFCETFYYNHVYVAVIDWEKWHAAKKEARRQKYLAGKERARQMAMDYQNAWADGTIFYWSDVFEIEGQLRKLGKRYGLLKEFKENGIV